MGKETNLEELGLSVRAYHCLRRRGIRTVEDLCALTEEELKKTRNLGLKAREEVLKALAVRGLALKEEAAK